jgi:anti-sigma regulatory factor (Ser/Thr protein kinase)
MRTGAAAGHAGCFHETAFYASDDELVDVVRPFVVDGVAAGEPTIVALHEHSAGVLRRALGDTAGVTFLRGADQYTRPASTIRSYRSMFASLVASGAAQIRVLGDMPNGSVSWAAWARYEAAVNHAYDDFPVWGLCPYDLRHTPDDVLEDARRTHPYVATGAGAHEPSTAFVPPEKLLVDLQAPFTDVEQRAPDVVLDDPTPAEARRAAVSVAGAAQLPEAEREDLELALSELVTNARMYGMPPRAVLLWVGRGRVVARVDDGGRGPGHPLAGLVPVGGPGGLGLWIVHQACRDVRMRRHERGFSVVVEIGTAG